MSEKEEYECPECGSNRSHGNGRSKQGKIRRVCKDCGKYYTIGLERRKVPKEYWSMIWRMIDHEGVSIKGASRVTGVSESYIRAQNTKRLAQVKETIDNDELTETKKKSLIIQMDEMHSFVTNKSNVIWIWLAMDIETRRIVAIHFGGRTEEDAREFIAKIPRSYLEHAVIDTDGLAAYEKPLFEGRYAHYQWVGKGSGMTNYIERFNGTLRRKCARLTRKSYCFSKNLWYHKMSILQTIHDYNRDDAPRIVAEHAKRRRWRQLA